MRAGLLNENANRKFPFLVGTTATLPDSTIADFGCLMGLDAQYEAGEDDVFLYAIVRTGSSFTFDFRTTTSGLSNHRLVFTRTLSDARYTTEFVDATTISAPDDDGNCDYGAIWSGYLVTGDLADLASILPSGNTMARTGNSFVIEPALVQDLAGGFVRSINLANDNRTRVASPEGCRPLCWDNDQDTSVLFVNDRCITGMPRFAEGYNCSITQNDSENSITIGAIVGAGAGEPCEEVPLFEDEAPPTGSTLLTGGLTCQEAIRSINGVGGRLFTVNGGVGVTVTPLPDEHKLVIAIDMQSLAVCATFEDTPDSDCSDTSVFPDDCECGDLN